MADGHQIDYEEVLQLPPTTKLDYGGDTPLRAMVDILKGKKARTKFKETFDVFKTAALMNNCSNTKNVFKIECAKQLGIGRQGPVCLYEREEVKLIHGKITDTIARYEKKAMDDKKILVIGNPGIGKSLSALYSAIKIAQSKQKSVIWFNLTSAQKIDVLFMPKGKDDAIFVGNVNPKVFISMLVSIERDHKYVIFLDGMNKEIENTHVICTTNTEALCFWISSGRFRYEQENKQSVLKKTHVHYEGWKIEEYKALLEHEELLGAFVESSVDIIAEMIPFCRIEIEEKLQKSIDDIAALENIEWAARITVKDALIELLKSNPTFKESVLKRKHYFAGSSARWLLELRVQAIKLEISNSSSLAVTTNRNEVGDSEKLRDMFLPNTLCNTNRQNKVSLVSAYAVKELVAQRKKINKDKMIGVITSSTLYWSDFGANRGVKGVAFEQFVLALLREVRDRPVHFLQKDGNDLELQGECMNYSGNEDFGNLCENTWAFPKNIYQKGFDFLFIEFENDDKISVYFVQATIAQIHSLNMDFAKSLCSFLNMKYKKKIWVTILFLGDEKELKTEVNEPKAQPMPKCCFNMANGKTITDVRKIVKQYYIIVRDPGTYFS